MIDGDDDERVWLDDDEIWRSRLRAQNIIRSLQKTIERSKSSEARARLGETLTDIQRRLVEIEEQMRDRGLLGA